MSPVSTNPANGERGLRIGLSVRTLCHPDFNGRVEGLGVYTRELWRRLEAAPNVEIHPIVGYGRGEMPLAARYPRGFAFPFGYAASGALAMLAGMRFPGSRRLADRIDVYHATDYRVPKLSRTPVVATLHDAIPLTHPELGTPKYRAIKNVYLRAAARWADAIITVSAASVPSVVEQFRVAPERVTVIHNGVGDEWFTPVAAESRADVLAHHGLSPGFFLTVGTLQPRKNLGRVLAAFRALPLEVRRERPLVIVGRMGWGVDDLLPAIGAGQASREVFWLRYLPDDQLRAVFQSARTLVFPSLDEGFGLPVVEAFASRTPVLTSNVSALPEIAGDAALRVDPYDVDAIRESMLALATDDALCARLVAAGLVRARSFSWDTCAERVLQVYRQVAR